MSVLEASVQVEVGEFRLDVDLDIDAGRTIAVIGPNGAGKTTLLRTVSGLRPLTRGRICFGSHVYDAPAEGIYVPPEGRPVGLLAQHVALFPHMNVRENVAFGLRARGRRKASAHREAGAWLERVGLGDRATARPSELSGGQAQRVALARALATEPQILLLDEPLASLDASTRNAMRRELRGHLGSFAGVCILVTHDPLDAAALAQRVVVLEYGRVVQDAAPEEITARPRSAWAAELAGINLLRGVSSGAVVTLDGGSLLHPAESAAPGRVLAAFSPRAVALHATRPGGSPRNVWRATVASVEAVGSRARVTFSDPTAVTGELTLEAAFELRVEPGVEMWIAVKATEIEIYPA